MNTTPFIWRRTPVRRYGVAASLASAAIICFSAFSQTTPVLIPLNSLFGGQAYNKPLTITAANSVVWDGSQFWAGTYTVVPASATNPIVSLYPASYLLTIPGVVPAVRFNVPPEPVDGSNGPAVWTMVPSSGPAVYFGTNILASLQFGAGMSFVTNANGSVTVSVGSVLATQLTGTMALAQLPGQVVTNYSTAYIPSGVIDWWAGDSIPAANGSAVTDWVGINGTDLHGQNGIMDRQTCGGHASIYCSGATLLTNNIVVPGSATNTFTLFLVIKQHRPLAQPGVPGVPISFGATWPPAWWWTPLLCIPGAYYGCANTSFGNSGTYELPYYSRSYDLPIVYAFEYSSTALTAWMDGKISWTTAIITYGGLNYTPNIGPTNPFCIGADFGLLRPFTGFVAECGLCSNALSFDLVDKTCASLCQKYGVTQPLAVNFDGDSMTWGGWTSWQSNLLDCVGSSIKGVSLTTTAIPGETSAEMVANLTNWQGSAGQSSKKVAAFWSDLVNGSETASTVATNATIWAHTLATNGWSKILVIPPSSVTADVTDGNQRMPFLQWATNGTPPLWTTMFDGLVDLSRDPNVGPVGAYLNTAYYPASGGQIHWTNSAYAETVPGFFVPVIQNVLYGAWTCTQTNTPPPTVWQPWIATDPNAPGVQFINNNGQWAPTMPGSTALALQSTLDDFMNIDVVDSSTIPATLLPAIAGNYFGVGRFANGTGSWVFYFDPPRWPLFQASGLTNQVLYTHVWVTNAATINWQANVRFFTNGGVNAGFGSQTKTFGSGVFQCASGTNDYWILATNNFPPSVMTNISFAEFCWGNLSPSTNCWIVEGTKLHAQ